MWNRLFKSKASKDGTSKKRTFSSIIKGSSSESRSNKANNSSASTSNQNNSKVLSDSEDFIDASPEIVELIPCPICARTFAPSTLDKHVGICEKMHIQKRSTFDSFRQRREGTDLETYLPSSYGLIAKPKTSKLSPNDTKSASKSISSVYDASTKLPIRRVTPRKEEKVVSKESPLMNRSMTKRSLGPINEVCPHCGRSFGHRAYDRHVEWCREKVKIAGPTMSAQQHLAKERMQARTKYKAPTLRSKRDKNREKYSSLSESMNNLSDRDGVSIIDFNSVTDPYERGRKSSIMSLSMTSSIASDGGYSDKYDPFISAKRQLEDLFDASGMVTSTPTKETRRLSPTNANMSTSLTAKSPSSPTRTQNLSKSNFRRTSSLRVPKKTSTVSYMPKYKPSIQRGISDEGPISSNFMKPEEFDELPVKSHAIIPPDLVPKSPKPPNRRDPPLGIPTSGIPSSGIPSPSIVIKRQTNSIHRRNVPADGVKNVADFPLTKTDSLAAFLKFEDDLECTTEEKDEHLSEKELKDKSNNMNKRSISEINDNNKMDDEFGGDSLPAIEPTRLKQPQNNPIKLAPIEKSLIKNKLMLETLTANAPECNNNNIRIDDNDNSIDSNLINSCDNLRISNLSKLPNESSSFDQSQFGFVLETSADTSIENQLVTNEINFNCDSTRSSSSTDSIDSHHQNMELIANLKNINDTDKRNPKRQMQLHKDNLLFDNATTTNDNNIEQIKQQQQQQQQQQFNEDLNDNHIRMNALSMTQSNSSAKQKASFDNSDNIDDGGRKLSAKDVQNIEALFDDFDLEEFISSFSDNEQFPIFKNYKKQVSTNRLSSRKLRHGGSESTSEESEFDDKFDISDIDVSKKERNLSASSSVDREKCDSLNSLETCRQLKPTSFEKKSLKKPDVTVEAEKRMQIESELNKIVHKKHTTDMKLNHLQEILGESGELSQAERELLASVQELNSMCDDSNTLDLTSNVFTPKNDGSTNGVEATFKSLFLKSPIEKINNGSIRFNQSKPILSYQMPEIVGLTSSTNNDLGRLKPTTHLERLTLKTDTGTLNTNGTKLNSLNGFDRVLPPITTVHKNDSQNIYNTINMTSNISYHDGQSHKRTDSNNCADRRLSSPLSLLKKEPTLPKLSKFCHECGAKFLVEQAKFCMDCGIKRAILE